MNMSIEKLAGSLSSIPTEDRLPQASAAIMAAINNSEVQPDQLDEVDSKLAAKGIIGSGSLVDYIRGITTNVPNTDSDLPEELPWQ